MLKLVAGLVSSTIVAGFIGSEVAQKVKSNKKENDKFSEYEKIIEENNKIIAEKIESIEKMKRDIIKLDKECSDNLNELKKLMGFNGVNDKEFFSNFSSFVQRQH